MPQQVVYTAMLANNHLDPCMFVLMQSATSGVASLARLPWGSQVDVGIAAERIKKGQPPQIFQLYEFGS